MMTEKTKQDQLYDEMFDLEREIYDKLGTLIKASWDSNTLKMEIEKLVSEYNKIDYEIYLLQKDEDHSHPESKKT